MHYVPVGTTHRVWLREISEELLIEQGLEDLGSDFGLFVAVEDMRDGTMQVLCKAADELRGSALVNLIAAGLSRNVTRPNLTEVAVCVSCGRPAVGNCTTTSIHHRTP